MIRKPICPQGHDKRLVGRASNRQCRMCRQAQQVTSLYNVHRNLRAIRHRRVRMSDQIKALLAELYASIQSGDTAHG
jgi:hypothetical protein